MLQQLFVLLLATTTIQGYILIVENRIREKNEQESSVIFLLFE